MFNDILSWEDIVPSNEDEDEDDELVVEDNGEGCNEEECGECECDNG